MNLRQMTCPSCGASLDIDLADDRCRCSYCGTEFYVEDKPVRKNVEELHKKKPNTWTAGVIVALLILAVCSTFLIFALVSNRQQGAESRNYAENFDPYDAIYSVWAEGVSGYAKIKVEFAENSYETMGSWEISKETDLANGDVVTITFVPVTEKDFYLDGKLYNFSADTVYGPMEYTISGLDEFVTDVNKDGVPAERFEEMKRLAEEHIRTTELFNLSSEAEITILSTEYLGYVVRIKKDEPTADFILFYRVGFKWYDEEMERYVPVKYTDVKMTADGILDCNYLPTFKMYGAGSGSVGRSDYLHEPYKFSAYVYGFTSESLMHSSVVTSAESKYDIYEHLNAEWE